MYRSTTVCAYRALGEKAAVLQTMFYTHCSCTKSFVLCIKFLWSMFLSTAMCWVIVILDLDLTLAFEYHCQIYKYPETVCLSIEFLMVSAWTASSDVMTKPLKFVENLRIFSASMCCARLTTNLYFICFFPLKKIVSANHIPLSNVKANVTGPSWGESTGDRWTLDSPHKGPVTQKAFTWNDVVMFGCRYKHITCIS